MIQRFRHNGLERLFTKGDLRGVDPQQVRKLRALLGLLDDSTGPEGMNVAGLRLHPLKGEHRGQWAVTVSGNLRLVFEFDGENATNVDLVDYH